MTEKTEKETRAAPETNSNAPRTTRALFLAADAVVFSSMIFLASRAALLRLENIGDLFSSLYIFTIATITIFILEYIHSLYFGGKRFFLGLCSELLFLIAAVIAPIRITTLGAGPLPFYKLPFILNQFPRDLLLFARLSAWAAAAAILIFILAVLYITRKSLESPPTSKYARFFTRVAFFALVVCFSAAHYLPVLPISDSSGFERRAGVTRIFPSSGRPFAGFGIDPDAIAAVLPDQDTTGAILVSSGNTIVRIDGKGNCSPFARLKHDADILAADPWRRSIYAADAESADLTIIPASKTEREKTVSVRTDWSRAPRALLPFDNIFYVLYDGRPGIAEFDTDTLSQNSGIQFLQPRAISFRTGGWGLGAHRPSRTLFALAGALDASHKSVLLQFDPERFTTVGMGTLPDSGAAFAVHPSLPLAYMGSFHKNKLYEIDLPTMRVRRMLPGPASCRALALDRQRNILFASGRFGGRLVSVDLNSGEILRSDATGARTIDLRLDEQNKFLYLASSSGIYRIDIASYTGVE